MEFSHLTRVVALLVDWPSEFRSIKTAIFIHEEVDNVRFNCTEEAECATTSFIIQKVYFGQVRQKAGVMYSATNIRLTLFTVI
jgi:hypothetical protein